MDYKKFHRTNVIIELVGITFAAVWAIVTLFLAESHPIIPLLPVQLAFIIKSVRILMLTGHEDYQQESYSESQKTSYTDNRTLYIISVICSCVASVLVIIKAFVL